MIDLPLWRVDVDASGREIRLVELPFEHDAYDMRTSALTKSVLDRNHDGVADRVITYDGLGSARTEETDTDFDGRIDLWETFAAAGNRLRSARAEFGAERPNRIATYEATGQVRRVEVDSNLDGRPELVQIFESGRLTQNLVDSDGNGRVDRRQEFSKGYLSSEEFDVDEDGEPELRMTYGKDGGLLQVITLKRPGAVER